MLFDPQNCCRVLVIDDDPLMQEMIRRILSKSNRAKNEDGSDSSRMPSFEFDTVDHGEDGLNLIGKSLHENRPYSLAFGFV
jgi:CheY-like chemotaxis protein